MSHIVIIGGGHAAGQLVASLKEYQFDGTVTLITQEAYLPYHRPPLSKAYLSGEKSEQQLAINGDGVYESDNIRCITEQSVTQISPACNTLNLSNGEVINYDYLAITTGSSLRTLDIPGHNLAGLHYLKNIRDAQTIKAQMADAKNLVVIGGGYIGLEIAASARKLGLKVTVVERSSRILERVVAPEVSTYIQQLHTDNHVKFIFNATVEKLLGINQVNGILCAGGNKLDADLVIAGIGVMPNEQLAAQAGIHCDNGIVIDQHGRTSISNIFAAGDCANQHHAFYDQPLRIESVQNATEQAKAIAAYLTGNHYTKESIPWFWSTQYDYKIQIAGLNQGYDTLITREKSPSSCSFFYLKNNKLISCDAINNPADFMLSKKLIAQQKEIDIKQLANSDIPLKQLLV